MRDCFLPAALWPTLFRLDTATDLALAFHLWAAADRDGVVPVDPGLPSELVSSVTSLADPDPVNQMASAAAALLCAGFAVVYRGLDGVPWAWLPDVPIHAPPQPLRRPVEDAWPAPHPDAVRALLTARLGREASEAECRQACPRAYGKRRAAAPPVGDHVDRVYRAWAGGQVDADGDPVNLPTSASPIQRRMILAAMKEAAKDPAEAAEALILIFMYVYGADEKPARYLRGQNSDGRKYLGLDNLTVASKVQSRLAFARAWTGSQAPPPVGGNELDGVNLGPLARFR